MRHRILALLFVIGAVTARSQTSAADEAETYVLETLAKGDVADLTTHFNQPEQRILKAAFVEHLLTGGPSANRIDRRGVRITGATIKEPLDLTNALIDVDVRLENCTFGSAVNFSHTEWKQDLTLNGSRFTSLNLSLSTIAGSLRIDRTEFSGQASLPFLRVGRAIEADGAKFLNVSAPASFNSVTVNSYARFMGAVFAGGADFINANIGFNLYLGGATFSHPDAAVQFERIHVGDSIAVDKPVIFSGPVNFQEATVVRHFSLSGSEFRSTGQAVTFQGIQVGGSLILDRTKFSGPATFTRAHIGGLLYLDNAEFSGPAPQLNLIHVDSILRLTGATFAGGLNLTGAELKDDLNAARIHLTKPDAKLTLYRANIQQSVFMNNSEFNGEVDNREMHVGIEANFEHSHFRSEEDVDFSGSQIKGDFGLGHSDFSGNVDLSDISVGGDLLLGNATTSAGVSFDLTDAKIGRDMDIGEATFRGNFTATDADIKGTLIAEKVRFLGPKSDIEFNPVHVHERANFTGAEFGGSLKFDGTDIGDDLYLDDAHARGDVEATSMKIAQDLTMQNAIFDGTIDWTSTSMGGDWNAEDAHFNGPSTVVINNVHVNGDLTFSGVEFKDGIHGTGTVVGGFASFVTARTHKDFLFNTCRVTKHLDLDGAEIGGQLNLIKTELGTDLRMRGTSVRQADALLMRMTVTGVGLLDHVETPVINLDDSTFYNLELTNLRLSAGAGELRLTRTLVQHELTLRDSTINNVFGNNLRVGGTARFGPIQFQKLFTLENSIFEALYLPAAETWNFASNALRLDAASYNEVVIGDGKNGVAAFLPLLERASFSPSTYTVFEQYCAKNGLDELGRQAFVNYQRRSAREGNALRRLWSFLMDVFVRYGKSPERAFLYALAFILLGRLVFVRSRMVPLKPEFTHYHYSPWWYSLDRLIPVADLGMKNVWGPRQTSSLARNYMRVHIILGYLLITVGLAAVSGLVK